MNINLKFLKRFSELRVVQDCNCYSLLISFLFSFIPRSLRARPAAKEEERPAPGHSCRSQEIQRVQVLKRRRA